MIYILYIWSQRDNIACEIVDQMKLRTKKAVNNVQSFRVTLSGSIINGCITEDSRDSFQIQPAFKLM